MPHLTIGSTKRARITTFFRSSIQMPKTARKTNNPATSRIKRQLRRMLAENLEARRCLSAFNNPVDSEDVDGNFWVTPLDALIVIHDLNSNGSRRLPERRDDPLKPYLDVYPDEYVTALDALFIVNTINANGSYKVDFLEESDGSNFGKRVDKHFFEDFGAQVHLNRVAESQVDAEVVSVRHLASPKSQTESDQGSLEAQRVFEVVVQIPSSANPKDIYAVYVGTGYEHEAKSDGVLEGLSDIVELLGKARSLLSHDGAGIVRSTFDIADSLIPRIDCALHNPAAYFLKSAFDIAQLGVDLSTMNDPGSILRLAQFSLDASEGDLTWHKQWLPGIPGAELRFEIIEGGAPKDGFFVELRLLTYGAAKIWNDWRGENSISGSWNGLPKSCAGEELAHKYTDKNFFEVLVDSSNQPIDTDRQRPTDEPTAAPVAIPDVFDVSGIVYVPANGVLANDFGKGKLRAQIVEEPAKGYVSLAPNGAIVYVPVKNPAESEYGKVFDQFEYIAIDTELRSSRPTRVMLLAQDVGQKKIRGNVQSYSGLQVIPRGFLDSGLGYYARQGQVLAGTAELSPGTWLVRIGFSNDGPLDLWEVRIGHQVSLVEVPNRRIQKSGDGWENYLFLDDFTLAIDRPTVVTWELSLKASDDFGSETIVPEFTRIGPDETQRNPLEIARSMIVVGQSNLADYTDAIQTSVNLVDNLRDPIRLNREITSYYAAHALDANATFIAPLLTRASHGVGIGLTYLNNLDLIPSLELRLLAEKVAGKTFPSLAAGNRAIFESISPLLLAYSVGGINEASRIAAMIGDHANGLIEAFNLFELGNRMFQAGDHTKASSAWEKSLKLYIEYEQRVILQPILEQIPPLGFALWWGFTDNPFDHPYFDGRIRVDGDLRDPDTRLEVIAEICKAYWERIRTLGRDFDREFQRSVL